MSDFEFIISENMLSVDTTNSPMILKLAEGVVPTSPTNGAVTSVNGKIGVVVLNPDDLDDTSTTNKFTTATEIAKLSGIEAGATADQTGAEIVTAIDTQLGTTSWQTSTSPAGSQYEIQFSDGAGNFSANAKLKTNSNGSLLINTADISDGDYLLRLQENNVDKFYIKTRDGAYLSVGSSRYLDIVRDGIINIRLGYYGANPCLHLGKTGEIRFNANDPISGLPDVSLKRNAPALLEVTDGSTGGGGIVKADTGYTYSTLDNTAQLQIDCSKISTLSTRKLYAPDFDFDFNNWFNSTEDVLSVNPLGATASIKLGNMLFAERSFNDVYLTAANWKSLHLNLTECGIRRDVQLSWSNDQYNASATKDVGIKRNTAGLLEITDGSTGGGSLQAKTLLTTTNKTGTLASPPTGLVVGEQWSDTTDSTTHPIIRISTVAT